MKNSRHKILGCWACILKSFKKFLSLVRRRTHSIFLHHFQTIIDKIYDKKKSNSPLRPVSMLISGLFCVSFCPTARALTWGEGWQAFKRVVPLFFTRYFVHDCSHFFLFDCQDVFSIGALWLPCKGPDFLPSVLIIEVNRFSWIFAFYSFKRGPVDAFVDFYGILMMLILYQIVL